MRRQVLTYIALTAVVCAAWSCQKNAADDKVKPVVRETVGLPLQDPDARVVTLKQVNRSELRQEINVPANAIFIDTFRQQDIIPPKIDILIVIDNSGSMEEEQISMAEKFEDLISDLNEVDWQINIITTDNTCKRLPELPLKPDTPDLMPLFQKAIRAGTDGSGYERGLRIAMDHLKGACSADPDWIREKSDLAIVIVSDEDEDSSSRYHLKHDLFLDDLEALGYVLGKDAKVHGIIGHPSVPCPNVEAPGVTYAAAIQGGGGLWGSICAPDYSPTLSAISRDMRKNLTLDFPLRFVPVLNTIRLELDGIAYVGDWTIIGQRLVLANGLPENSTLNVHYQVESFRLLRLNVDSAKYILDSISIDGTYVDPSRYTYDAVSNTVFFLFDPPAGSTIETKLVENTKMRISFPFPQSKVKDINCYIEGTLFKTNITLGDGVINLDPTIPANSLAHCLYE
jgi:hypothetical protein